MNRLNNDYDEIWKAKSVNIDNLPKKYPKNYIKNNKSEYTFNIRQAKTLKNSTKKFTTKPINKNQRTKNTEVVVRITSTSTSFNGISEHISYITRHGALEVLYTDLDYSLMELQYSSKGKEHLNEIKSFYKDEFVDFSKTPKKEYRESYNIVFSTKDYYGNQKEFFIDPDSVKIATYKTIKNLFPDNHFSLVLHTDTNNPHCHVCLKVKDKFGKRLDIRKKDIFNLRRNFAKELNELGIEATATYKKDRIERDIKLSQYDYVMPQFEKFMIEKNIRLQAKEKNCFEIVNFGEANFDFKDENPKSYFITYLTKDYKPINIWGEDLKRIVEENNLQKGDFARFGKIGFDYKMQTTYLHKNNALFEVKQPIKFSKWDCVIFDKNEREVNKNELDKMIPPKKPDPIWKFIKTLDAGENNERPNRITRDEPKQYTREQWARYYARKRKVAARQIPNESSLYFTSTTFNSKGMPTSSFDNLRTMPKSHLDTFQSKFAPSGERSTAKLLLPNDTHDYISNSKPTSDSPLRWANSRTTRANTSSRENLEL